MRALSAAEILDVWERGSDRHPAERALALMAAACPEWPSDDLLGPSVGQRDALLLAVRERTFGGSLTGIARCPECAEPLEFTAQTSDLRAGPGSDDEPAVMPRSYRAMLPSAGTASPALDLIYRLPTGGDLIALRDVTDVALFRRALAVRCVMEATWSGAAIPAGELPDDLLTALAGEMSSHDPQAEVLLDLACPACGEHWQAVFDIAAFLWTELAAEAKRLLREVDALARAYGWREADILALSPRRRQMYMEMVRG